MIKKTNVKKDKYCVATVTVHHAHNFGAMLQAYALQRALKKCGYDTEIIDYDEIQSTIFPRLHTKSIKGVLSWLFYTMKSVVKYNALKIGYSRFEYFYKHDLITSIEYKEIDQIDTEKYDMVIVGSDQVWSFKRDGNRPYFQLDFVENKKCASFAASMGSYMGLTNSMRESFRKSLKRFCAISVREKETGDYIQNLTGIEYHMDPDPVFLLGEDEWDTVAKKSYSYILPTDYILCYELIKSDNLNRCTEKLKEKTKLPVVVLSPTIYYKVTGDYIFIDAGPCEMVSLIKNAKYVVTNSFHGTAFSVIYHKAFWAILTSHGPGRITELLDSMGLSDRIYRDGSHLLDIVDFKTSDSYIRKSIEESYSYLNNLRNFM